MKFSHRRQLAQDQCCFCGLSRCRQSVDHNYMTLNTFRKIIEEGKVKNQMVDELKEKANIFYKYLKQQVCSAIDQDNKSLHEHLNKFYYSYINPKSCNINDLCQFSNGCFEKLPSKKALKIINAISNKKNDEVQWQAEGQLNQLKEELGKYLQKSSITKQMQKLKNILPFSKAVQNNAPELKLTRSTSSISNPQQNDEQQASIYTWKNFPIKSKTKVLELNNKNINDEEMLGQIQKLSSFKNVQQLQIRNNKITSFSCQLIANNMQHIKSLDLRGNRVGDQGIRIIVRSLSHLKGLLISETAITDASLNLISTQMRGLQKLWCQNNQITADAAILVANIPTLRMLSFAGCKLNPENTQKLKTIFYPKGYICL